MFNCGFEEMIKTRAVDPHSFFADPDPAVFLNADPDPAQTNFYKITLRRVFFSYKRQKKLLKITVRNNGDCANLLYKFE